MRLFNPSELKLLYKPANNSSGEDNGQVTIIGGSKLFHGAPLLSLKVASRITDMVFFATPESSIGELAQKIKSKLFSFIWIPWEDVESYIQKSDAVLIGPGLMRFHSEKLPYDRRHLFCDDACRKTREITERFLKKFPEKKWVIDAGSLQTIGADVLPKNCVITPNRKEFELLFNIKNQKSNIKNTNQNVKIVQNKAREYNCVIVLKGPKTIVASADEVVIVRGGNPGMTKGGTGDVQAGLTVALLAKNEPFLSASAASYITKAAADELFKKVGTNFNADDLSDKIPEVFKKVL